MRMRLKLVCGIFVTLCILEYIKAQPGGNEVSELDYQRPLNPPAASSMSWTEKAKSLISGPAGQIVANLAKEMLSRSTGNSQVLSLNLTNLFILLFLKALIFSAGLIGTGHWGGGGHYGRARSDEKSFLEYEEVPLMLGYLASEGSGQKGCLYRAACLAPYSALDYAKAGHAVLKGSEIFNPDLKHDFHYNHILKGLERAAMEGIENVPCEMVYPCSSWLSVNTSAK